jgi:hypothetical protein
MKVKSPLGGESARANQRRQGSELPESWTQLTGGATPSGAGTTTSYQSWPRAKFSVRVHRPEVTSAYRRRNNDCAEAPLCNS